MTGRNRRDRHHVGDSDRYTDAEVDQLIERSQELLEELRKTFAEIKTVLQKESPS